MQTDKKIFWLIFVYFLTNCPIYAQNDLEIEAFTNQYRIQKLGKNEGMPDNVYDIIEDNLGFIWLATDKGLVKYDGNMFHYHSLAESNYTKFFLRRRDSSIWFAADAGIGTVQNFADSSQIKLHYKSFSAYTDSTLDYPKRLYEDRQGNLWISNAPTKGVLSKLHHDQIKHYYFEEKNNLNDFFRSFFVFEDSQNRVWTMSIRGFLYYYDAPKDQFQEVVIPQIMLGQVQSLVYEKGSVWVGTTDGLYEMKLDKKETQVSQIRKVEEGNISDIFWLNGKQLIWVDQGTNRILTIEQDSVKALFKINRGFRKLYQDRLGNLWAGCDNGVLVFYTYEGTITLGIGYVNDLKLGARNSEVWAVANSSLKKITLADNQYQITETGVYPTHTILQNSLGLATSDNHTNQVNWFGRSGAIRLEKLGNFIFFSMTDSRNNMWVCQNGSQGTVKIGENLQPKLYPMDSRLVVVREGQKGELYGGGIGKKNYLFRYNPLKGQFDNISLPNPDFSTEIDFVVNDIAVDDEQTIWLGTNQGVWLYKDNRIMPHPINERLKKTSGNQTIMAMHRDKRGRMWIGYDGGVFMLEKDKPLINISEENGLISNLLSYRCIISDSVGRIYIGTDRGVSVIDDKFHLNITQKPLLTSVLYQGQKIRSLKGLVATYPFVMHFNCLEYTNRDILYDIKVIYEGDTLQQYSKENKYLMHALQTGNYTVMVRAQKKGALPSEPLIVEFTVKQIWYKSWWAILVYFLGISALIYLSVKINAWRLEQQKEALEELVLERTEEISEQNQLLEQQKSELQTAYENLKATQAQLVQSEKMAGIGTLTAGIAHEINNPINFVKNNIVNVENNLHDIMEVVQAYDKITAENAEANLLEIKKLKKKKDFDIAVEEMEELVRGIKEGANRTAEIVRSLRTFTRLDDHDHQPANLHDNIDSTLLLLQNQYKDHIEIVKNYGKIPLVNCYIGKINQVFMNLLSNAMQAIEGNGTITISTEVVREDTDNGVGEKTAPLSVSSRTTYVLIKIRDTGKGIPEAIRHKVFEPFFTTKDVGKGTGLGLSISLGIAQNHGGNLTFESKVGEGTEFILTLPVE